jgi:serine/threonine protein phosphatase 1
LSAAAAGRIRVNFLRAARRDQFAQLRRPAGADIAHENGLAVESVRLARPGAGPTRVRAVAAPEKFARLRAARRVWAVASVHGEARRLSRLHDLIGERFSQGDRLVYLGNYLGHGEDVGATINELLDFRRRVLGRTNGFACDVVYLRGAQEEMWQKLLQLQFAPNPTELLSWLVRAGVEATVRAYGGDLRQGFAAARDGPRTITRWTSGLRAAMNAAEGHSTLFAALRHAALTHEKGLLFVHAGIDPRRPLNAQGDAFWWGALDILEMSAPFAEFRRVIRGYDRDRRGIVQGQFGVSVDGGAGRGGPLQAACIAADGAIVDFREA